MAIVLHLGGPTSGHFVTYRKIKLNSNETNPKNSKNSKNRIANNINIWFRISDRVVQEAGYDGLPNDILNGYCQDDIYMVFYTLIH